MKSMKILKIMKMQKLLECFHYTRALKFQISLRLLKMELFHCRKQITWKRIVLKNPKIKFVLYPLILYPLILYPLILYPLVPYFILIQDGILPTVLHSAFKCNDFLLKDEKPKLNSKQKKKMARLGIINESNASPWSIYLNQIKNSIPRQTLFLDVYNLSQETIRILKEPNAGGNSERSEAYAMEFLIKTQGAKNIFTEMEVKYHYPHWKKCDFITTIQKENVGVSVTRLLPPKNLPIDQVDIYIANLLHKKLYGLVVSRAGAVENCVFSQSILFVWSPHPYLTQIFQMTFDYCTDPSLKEDVKLILVETDESSLRSDFIDKTKIQVNYI